MVTLNQIRQLIIKQDEELEEIIFKYFYQKYPDLNNLQNKMDVNLENYKQDIKNKIQSCITQNELDEAKQLLKEYIQIDRDDISIYSMSGIINLQENNIEEANNEFIKGLKLDSTNIDLLYNMGYLNLIKGNSQEAIYYYNKCLSLTKDQELINEINEIINNNIDKLGLENFTIITFGIEKDDNIFNQLKDCKNNIINILEKEECIYDNKYEDNGILMYEVNPEKSNDIIEYLIRRNENCIILGKDAKKLDYVKTINNNIKTVYYTNKNYHKDKINYLNNIYIYLETQICNTCDFIITDDIDIYNYKKIIERRENIYLVNEIDARFTIKHMLKNFITIEGNIHNIFRELSETIEDEYEKSKYIIASEYNDVKKCTEIVKFIYEKYNTYDIYNMYLALLNQSQNYSDLIKVAIKSEYCEEIYKCELLYLNSLEKYDLIDFIININIKNYKGVEYTSKSDLNYKLALYNFEINRFKVALEQYNEIINNNSILAKSVLVNRNIGYLMYVDENEEYEKHYDYYEEFIEGLKEEKNEKIDFNIDDAYEELSNILKGYIL